MSITFRELPAVNNGVYIATIWAHRCDLLDANVIQVIIRCQCSRAQTWATALAKSGA